MAQLTRANAGGAADRVAHGGNSTGTESTGTVSTETSTGTVSTGDCIEAQSFCEYVYV